VTLKYIGTGTLKAINIDRAMWSKYGDETVQTIFKVYVLNEMKRIIEDEFTVHQNGVTKYTIEITIDSDIPESRDEFEGTPLYNPDYVISRLRINTRVDD